MSTSKYQKELRNNTAFASGEASRLVDSLPNMAEWFTEDAAATERALPRVVGTLPDLGFTRAEPTPKRGRFTKILRPFGKAIVLALVFGLGIASSSLRPESDANRLADDETTEASYPFVDNMIPEPDDWSDLDPIPSHSYSFEGFGYEPDEDNSVLSFYDDAFYSNADEVASLTPNVHEPSNEVAAQQSFFYPEPRVEADFAPQYAEVAQQQPLGADDAPTAYPSAPEYESVDHVAEVSQPVSQPVSEGFAGFQGYEFQASTPTDAYSQNYDEYDRAPPAPTQTALADHNRFLASDVPQHNGFNESAVFNDQVTNPNPEFSTNNADFTAFSQRNGYNSNESFEEGQPVQTSFAQGGEPSARDASNSQFMGFDSSLYANDSRGDSFPSADFSAPQGGEYVAQNFDEPDAGAPTESQRPDRFIRW